QAGHAGHGDVEDHQIGFGAAYQLDRLGSVGGLADDGQIGFGLEDPAQAAADDGVVVREQDPDLLDLVLEILHGDASEIGTSRTTSVPPPRRRRSWIRPPTSWARSRMPWMPAPSVVCVMPTPSSATRSTTKSPRRVRPMWTVSARACRATLVSASCATR